MTKVMREAQAHSPPHPVSPVVSILPGEQEEPSLILEDVDPHWEEYEYQEVSSPRGSEAAPADEEESEEVEQMPRWEPEKALKNNSAWEDNRHTVQNPKGIKGHRAGTKSASSSLSLPPDTHPSPHGHSGCQHLLYLTRAHLSIYEHGFPSFFCTKDSISHALTYLHLATFIQQRTLRSFHI